MIVTIAIIVLFGILLVILETFVPGGVAGFLGLLCILVAVVLAMMSEELSSWSHLQRTALAGGIVVGSAGILTVWLRCFAVKLFHRAFTLEAEVPSATARTACAVGDEGAALSELRPLGRAEIAGRRVEVRCEDGFAPAGARLCVIGHEPGNLIVRLIS